MFKILFTILVTAVLMPQICQAEDEVIWETEKIPGLNKIIVSPMGGEIYNTSDSTVQIRKVEDGSLIEVINFDDFNDNLNDMSITSDGRFLAVSGESPYIIIYDLLEKREVKRITTYVYFEIVPQEWMSTSISPDGTKLVGVCKHEGNSKLVVYDIETEIEVFNKEHSGVVETNSPNWRSSDFTPNGEFIVAQLDVGTNPDSLFIYNAQTLEVDNVLLNIYRQSNTFDSFFSYYESIVSANKGKTLIIYNLNSREQIEREFIDEPFLTVFSRESKEIISLIDTRKPHIYNYETSEIVYSYSVEARPKASTIDNKNIICSNNGKMISLKSFWEIASSIEKNNSEIIISPNPTNGLININLECNAPLINYQINNSEGLLINEGNYENQTNVLQIDFSSYPIGVYFLTINCNEDIKTYKIIKEG